MNSAECISCGNEVAFQVTPQMGMLVKCSKCDAQLEVVWLDPMEVDWPFDDDYGDDDDDEDEYYYEDD